METAVISYRVADFLKKHAPFHAVDEADLLALAGGGRVKFHEPNEYILWQGEPHRYQVFVIQQGTVSLWDESTSGSDDAKLRDIRGAGDMLGIERYNGAPACLYSARSESDVVIYAFPAPDFEAYVLKYPHAQRYVAAESRVTPDYHVAGERRDLARVFLHGLVARHAFPSCRADETVADAARRLLSSPSEAVIVVDADQHPRGVLTADAVLSWVAAGGAPQEPVEALLHGAPATIAPDASVADGLLTMGAAGVDALAITDDGTAGGRVQALVSRRDLAAVFGDSPTALLREIRVAASTAELGGLNQRARAFVLEQLGGPSSTDWLTRFTHLVDAAIVTRITELRGIDAASASFCFAGSSGRCESLTLLAPMVLGVFHDGVADAVSREQYGRVFDGLVESGYLPRDLLFEPAFYGASAREWKARYGEWVRDPAHKETYRVRTLFDVRHVFGRAAIWDGVETTIVEAVDGDFVRLLANDCLANLPPLTFFENAVVDSFGEHTATFRLEHSALRPLVDVGRVFALAEKTPLGRSTIERFASARAMLPEQEAIFREATDTLRVVLWQQGRVGISQGTSAAELPAALLSRHDRQVLKSGFRSILQLLEFTANPAWLNQL